VIQPHPDVSGSFPIELVFPPQGHFTQPYLALPCLKAFLVQHGFRDVGLTDASVEAYDHFLTADYLRYAKERVAARLPLSRFSADRALEFDELEGFRAAAEAHVSADSLIESVEAAKAVVRGPGFYDPETYVPAVRTLYHGLRLVSAAHFPAQLTPHNFTLGYANDRSADVLAATLDREQNLFIEYFERELLPRLVERRPRLVGLSVIYGSQLIPALTLGRLIKAALPECHVTAGGGFLAYIGKKLFDVPAFADCIDSMIMHEGEGPLLAMAEALRDGGSRADLGDVGSLIWFDRRAPGEAGVRNAPMHPVRLDEAPCPDFEGLPFEKYFSPQVVLPYDINRGCYYGECAFCTLPTVIGPGYRTRSAGHITDHVLELKQRYGVRHFNFITDCMPPGMIKDLPQELIEREADIRWWCDARVEPKAYDAEGARRLYAAGCRKLLFGFESATPRLLKLMQKGQSLKSTIQVARNCTDAGISVTFYAMVGFPSETREEARATRDFLVEHRDVVREVSLQTFHIDEVAQTYKDPERFGLRVLDDPAADLQLYHDYETSNGMTQAEAAEAFDDLMGALREHYDLFRGDTIYYFMQKSHYFLHLAQDVLPDEFIERCRARHARQADRGADPRLVPAPHLRFADLSHGYKQAIERLAHPLARAVRPDFTTGRFVEGALEAARAELSGIQPRPTLLAFAPGASGEFVEVSADTRRWIAALERAGSLGALLEAHPDTAPEVVERIEAFAARLHRLGLLTVPDPVPTARAL
jgi:anaerobic magnesium-protoporphyrin IX monomethyl ester cyclase